MLTLIGLGLFDERDLTLRGVDEAKNADKVCIELYTSSWHGILKNLEELIGKEIEVLSRKDLEENSKRILEFAKNQNVVIFVQGNPLIATTHASLILDAKKIGIETKVIHNASIVSAIGETGLHLYRFGPTVTIPFFEKTGGKLPESVYEVIKENKARGLHTLCLLDVIAEKNKFMSHAEGIKTLLSLEKSFNEGVFTEDTKVVIFARAGSDKSLIVYGKAVEVVDKDLGDPPMVLVIPGRLHFTEEEYLENFKTYGKE